MYRLTLEVSELTYKWIVSLLAAVEHCTGEQIQATVVHPRKGSNEQGEARVQYRAIGTTEALEALGETTVIGIIYSHLLTSGPCTVREIRDSKPYSDKSVQSVVHKLKHMGLVQAEAVQREGQ